MSVTEHPIIEIIDCLYDKPASCCSVPKLLAELALVFKRLPPKFQQAEPITSLTVNPGCLVRFFCEVRTVVTCRIPASVEQWHGGGDSLLLFRPEDRQICRGKSHEVAAVSLGCVIRDPDTKTQLPVVVKIFDELQGFFKGQQIFIVGILTYLPSFDELIKCRRWNRPFTHSEIAALMDHNESNLNPPGVRRVHVIFHELIRAPPRVAPAHEDEDKDGDQFQGQKSWCVLL